MTSFKKSHVLTLLVFVAAILAAALLFFRPNANKVQVVQNDGEPKVYQPVKYETQSWQTGAPTQDFNVLKTMIGAAATRGEVLDFYGNSANEYRYVSHSEPPLYVIESDKVFELSWYFAHPKDSDAIKQTSISHAQKAYAAMTAYYGEDGKKLMQAMLNQQTPPTIKNILLAKCENYLCQVIISK